MDFLDGSDAEEDNLGVDQDVENVLLGSDDEEAHSSHQVGKFSGSSFAKMPSTDEDDRLQHSEEEDDVLSIVLQGEEEPLDFEGGGSHRRDGGRQQRVPPVKVRTSLKSMRAPSHLENDNICMMPCSSNDEGGVAGSEEFQGRRYVEEDEFEDGDDDNESRNTRSRFTSERKVESFSGGLSSGASNSVGIPIQTVGERKNRPNAPENRPKHWNHGGPRQNGPRHPGRNQHRFQNSSRPPMDGPPMRPNMMHQPVVQFNDGIFTDFNQPMRHPSPGPGPRPRQPLPGRLEPRNLDHGSYNVPPQHSGNNPRPHMPPQNNRQFYPPDGPQNIPPRMHPPGCPPHQPPPPPQHMPDFNMRHQRPRFPPNNMHMNQRNPPPPHMNHMQGMPNQERPPYPPPPRHQRPAFRPDFPPQGPPGMPPVRHPNNQQGYPPPPQPPHNMPQNYAPPQSFPPGNVPPPRPPGTSPENGPNPFYVQQQQQPNYGPPRPDGAFQPDARWGGSHEQPPPPMSNAGPWPQHPNHPVQQQGYNAPGYGPMYDHPPQPSHMMHPSMSGHPQLPVPMQPPHHMEMPAMPIKKSIYINPNSEIHEALSKGHFLHPKSESRHESSHSSSSKYYDDQYHDRERSSSRRGSSPSDRRRDDDDYYDDRKSYHHHHDRRPRRKYDDDRRRRSRSRSRSRSASPERKYSRSERPNDRERERDRRREKDLDHKDSDKLLEEAKKMGLGEDYVKKLEEQRRLREKILKTKEQRRKQVKVAGVETENSSPEKDSKSESRSTGSGNSKSTNSTNPQKGGTEGSKEFEADSTVASNKGGGKPKKILRIVRDKTGKIISKKVHVVLVAKPQQEGQQQTSST